MRRCEHEQWINTLEEEFNSPISHNVGELVNTPSVANIIVGMWRLKQKRDEYGNIIKYKEQYGVLGNHKIHGVHFNKNYASVVQADMMKILSSLCAFEDWEMDQFNITTTFLNGQMSIPVFTRQVKGFYNPKFSKKVGQPKQSLYCTQKSHQ